MPFRPGRRLAQRLAALGRTEDLQFSPDQRRLALCCFSANRILVLSLAMECGRGGQRSVAAEAFVELSCAGFHHPHGLCWIDDSTLAVANRKGGLQIVAVPPAAADGPVVTVTPFFDTPGDGTHGVETPGSVAVAHRGRRRFDLYLCNNYIHSLARLRFRRAGTGGGVTLLAGGLLPARGLDIPDGVALGAKGRSVAISNHNRHRVDLFRRSLWTGLEKRAIAILQVPGYPHGLRFAAGDRALVVADAAAPLVHVFAPLPRRKVHQMLQPRASLRVMDDATFRRGQNNPQDGGPKGLDILHDGSLFALTCEETPLLFFDGAALGLV